MNKSLLRGIWLLIFGVAIIIVTAIIETNTKSSFRAGMFTGFGAGVTGVAITYIIKSIQYRKNPAKLEKEEMMSTEERQVMIRGKASSVAFTASSLTSAAIIMIFAAMNTKMEIILIVCGGMLINAITYAFMFYRYNTKY